MRRGLERRLSRLAEAVRRWTSDSDHEHTLLDARQVVADTIRAGLAAAGIDPDTVPVLRRYELPEPAPAPIRQAGRGDVDPRDMLFEKLRTLAGRYRDGPPPSLTRASPAELLAYYCFGDSVAGESA